MPVLQTPLWTLRLSRLRQWLLSTFTFSEPEVLFGGSVLSSGGEPIAFATVTLKGTRYETATNAAGHFRLHVPLRLCSGPLCLRVSARNYASLEEVVGGAPQADMQFVLRLTESARVIPFSRKAVRKTS